MRSSQTLLLNAQAGYRFNRTWSLAVDVFNLLNRKDSDIDYLYSSRLPGEPPHIMLVPRLGHIGLMEFHRAREAIAEGRACVEHSMPALRRYI